MTQNYSDGLATSKQDGIIREVRANREAYAARFDFDVRAILRRARERASEWDQKVVERKPGRVEEQGGI